MTATAAALVVGGSGAIGSAIVEALAARGCTVDYTCRTAPGEDVAGPRGTPLACDLADPGDLAALCDRCGDGDYDIFVHAAGMTCDGLVAGADPTLARTAMDVNFWSYVWLCKHLVRRMSRRRYGRIVAISSIAARRGNRGNAVYAATKGAMDAFTRGLAVEYAARGVTVNAIAPGLVATPMTAGVTRLQEHLAGIIPAGRSAAPSEIAALAAFLSSAEAGYITGAVLPVDGGLSTSMGA